MSEKAKASYAVYAKARDSKGYNDYRVAKETGIGTAVLSNWKNGRYEPKIDKKLAIAKVLEVPIEELIGA